MFCSPRTAWATEQTLISNISSYTISTRSTSVSYPGILVLATTLFSAWFKYTKSPVVVPNTKPVTLIEWLLCTHMLRILWMVFELSWRYILWRQTNANMRESWIWNFPIGTGIDVVKCCAISYSIEIMLKSPFGRKVQFSILKRSQSVKIFTLQNILDDAILEFNFVRIFHIIFL